jgi:hypothetical protein
MAGRSTETEAVVRPYDMVLRELRAWIEVRDCAGHEPYDLLNSPHFKATWTRRPPLANLLIQWGRNFGGVRLRHLLGVPASKNPKALALMLAGYCDLARCGERTASEAGNLKRELQRLRSPNEPDFCWGYDWDYVSLRGTKMRAFSANSIATCFAASALLDMAEAFGDSEAGAMARSAVQFVIHRLNRPVDNTDHLCFSYTSSDHTRIYNSSVLAGALLARMAEGDQKVECLSLAHRSMRYLVDQQNQDGSWAYGVGRFQQWIDGFHTGYNLCALLEYRSVTRDTSFDQSIDRGYEFYKRSFFRHDGAPKYFYNRLYPIDIHACSQAIMTFCAFRDRDPEALGLARRTADWTIQNMRSPEGTFFYQRHRLWTNRTPYMRWGQAWMFRALARLERSMMSKPEERPGSDAGVVTAESGKKS